MCNSVIDCFPTIFLLTDSGYNSTDVLSEATEMEYLRKVLFEYMMGRETKVCISSYVIVPCQKQHIEILTVNSGE